MPAVFFPLKPLTVVLEMLSDQIRVGELKQLLWIQLKESVMDLCRSSAVASRYSK